MTRILWAVFLLVQVTACGWQDAPEQADPPLAKRVAHIVKASAGERFDPYYWLRDDSRSAPDTMAYLQAENDYTHAAMTRLQPLVAALVEEMKSRIPAEQDSEFHRDGGYLYWTRYVAEAEFPVLMRRALREPAIDEVLLDGNALAGNGSSFQPGSTDISPDGRHLAWLQDQTGWRQYRILLRDLESGRIRDTGISGASSISWAADGRSLFYAENHPLSLRSWRVWRYWPDSGRGPELVHEENDEAFFTSVGRTRSDRYNYVYLDSTEATEMRVIDSAREGAELVVFLPRQRGHQYAADHDGHDWIIRSNWDAPNFRILRAPETGHEDRDRWAELVPHREQVFIEEFDPFENFLALGERHQGMRRLRLLDYRSGQSRLVEFDEPLYTAQLGHNPESDSSVLQFAYTSLTTPREIWEFDPESGQRRRIERLEVPGGFDPDDLVTSRLWVEARDGARIPVSVVHHKDTPLDGSAPLYQSAYGSYGLTIDPAFSSEHLSLLERGFVFALAHVRGSQAMGREWYEQGRLLNKINTFNDFVDVTRALVAQHLVDGNRVFAAGASAGGLLMGAIANMAPQDYAGIIAHVPFVDVVTTMLDESIPLTTNEFHEWGNPKQPQYYDYMLSYSPYDNVRAQRYPAMLVTAGLWDSQVPYWEPVKWVARLRYLKTDTNPLLLRVNMEAGHGGLPGRFRRLEQTALEYAFILDRAGLAD